jgi:hypothetical protein
MRVTTDFALKVREYSGSPPYAPILILSAADSDPESPFTWWRTRPPGQFTGKDSAVLRWALLQSNIAEEPYWPDAVVGKVTAAINIAIRCLKTRPINHPEVDLALSAMLACALDHDVTAGILISSALRRRAKIDPRCRLLSDLWLIADF